VIEDQRDKSTHSAENEDLEYTSFEWCCEWERTL